MKVILMNKSRTPSVIRFRSKYKNKTISRHKPQKVSKPKSQKKSRKDPLQSIKKNNHLPELESKVSKTSVNNRIREKLKELNYRDTKQIRTHLNTINAALNKDDSGKINLILGGSLQKHTYVHGISDVDVLAKIDKSDMRDLPPKKILKNFTKRLQTRLPTSKIKKGKLAATVKFLTSGREFQVLPTFPTENGIKLNNGNGKTWGDPIIPSKFTSKLTQINEENAYLVIPVIKIFKSITNALPEDMQLKGYHLENISTRAFNHYKGCKTPKDMLVHLTRYTSKAIKKPIRDVTGESDYLDSYLGRAQSQRRKNIHKALQIILRRMKRADSEVSLEKWDKLLNEI